MSPDPDLLAAELAGIRERSQRASAAGAFSARGAYPEAISRSAADVPRLLAAVEAVLALAGEFDTEDGTTPEDAQILGRPVSRGDRIRQAITRELLGKEGTSA
jgi:hypothetical protein